MGSYGAFPEVIRFDVYSNVCTTEADHTKAICVIGAGPSGLAALRAISEWPEYMAGAWTAVAFEARESMGGVWYVLILRCITPQDILMGRTTQATRTTNR